MPASFSRFAAKRQILDEHVLQDCPLDALRRDAGEAIDLAAAQRLGVGDRGVDAAAELVDAVGQDGDAALAAAPSRRPAG